MTAPRQAPAAASIGIAAILLSTLLTVPAQASPEPTPVAPPAAANPAPAAAEGRFVVRFKPGAPSASATRAKAYGQAAKASGVPVKELRVTAHDASVVQATGDLTPAGRAKVLASLRAQSNVDTAEPDTFVSPSAVNDPLYPNQWDLFEETAGMRAPAAWGITSGLGSIVAVIDTGITPHSDLASVLPGYDFISDPTVSRDGDGRDADATDNGDTCNGGRSSWHGTHVAGTIGAAANNNKGIAGVSYSARILPVRALGACGGYMSDIADSVIWAAGGTVPGAPANPNRATVINMSLGGYGTCSSYFQSALDFAAAQGVTVVAAAGNDGAPASGFTPANCRNIITVGATGREGNRAYYSNYGPEVDVSAPGGDSSTGYGSAILSTWNDGYSAPGGEVYGYMQGTSMAAPHVAGVAALILAVSPSLTPAQVEDILQRTARPLPGTCDTGGCGAGLIDAGAAVRAASPDAPAPAPSPEPAVAGTPVITGEPRVGSALTADPGTWTPVPDSFAYQWYRGDAAVPGATAATYVPEAADLGQSLAVDVTGSGGGHAGAVRSAPTTAVAPGVFTPATPTISTSSPRIGAGIIGADKYETWPADTVLTRAWLRSGVPIEGETTSVYWPKAEDVGHVLTFSVTGTRAGYTTKTVTSAPTDPVPALVLPDPGLSVIGTPEVGNGLVASYSGTTWRGVARTWQWYRGGQPIPAATTMYYTPTAADLGTSITARVTGTRPGYATATFETPAAMIAAGTLTSPVPTVSGTSKVGHALTAAPGTWTTGTTLRYQWYRSGVAISGATGARYGLNAADLGKTMGVRVTGSKAGYISVFKYSTPTTAVVAGTLAAGTPSIGGYLRVGYTLTAYPGTWTTGTALSYQWYRSGVAIRGATGKTYRLVSTDRYDTMKVRVTGTKAGYVSAARFSGATAVVR